MSEQSERVLKAVGELPSTGADVLDETSEFIGRFCAFPNEHCLVAVTLWAAHAHMVEHCYVSPRLALVSPEPESGKTRVLEVLDLLVPESMFSLSASPAAIFRTLAEDRVTLLFDEVDTIWGNRGKDDTHEDLRALLNAGYKRGATIPRCVGAKHEVQHFAVFCPVALAGIGQMPDTILTRSIIIRMRRRSPNEHIEPFRSRLHEPIGHAIQDRLATWAAGVGESVGEEWPELPIGIVDRPAELWEPLIAIADAAGGQWPQLARDACVHLCESAKDRRVSLGLRLLSDLRVIFGESDALYTRTIIERLCNPDDNGLDSDAPWAEIKGKEISERMLASMLKTYDVHSTKVREPAGPSLKGYRRADLWDAWQRWLPVEPGKEEQGEHAEQASNGAASSVPHRVPLVPFASEKGNSKEPEQAGVVPDVPHVPHSREPATEVDPNYQEEI